MPVFPANWSYWRFGWNFDLSNPNFSSNYSIGQFLSIPVQVNNGNVQKDFEFDTALLKVFFTAPAGTSITYPQLDAASGNIVNGNFVADGDVAHAQGLNQNAVQTGEVRMVLRVHDTGPTFRVVPSAVINTNNTPGTGRTDFSPFFITPKKGDVTVVGVPGSLSLTVTSPKDGQTLISCMITVTGTATGAQNISITVNGQPVTTASAANANDPNQVTFSTTIPGAGANTPIVVTASAPNNTSVTSTLHVSATSSTPPVVTASVTTPMLWPPNHDLINVGLSAGATSACDASPGLAVKVYSNEPDLDLGSGNFSPDARNVSTGALRLRSERSGNTISGRVYLVVAAGSDHFGNTGHACTAVTVPFDQSAAGIQAITAQAAAAINTCKGTGSAPNGYVQVGTGPVVGPKQ